MGKYENKNFTLNVLFNQDWQGKNFLNHIIFRGETNSSENKTLKMAVDFIIVEKLYSLKELQYMLILSFNSCI